MENRNSKLVYQDGNYTKVLYGKIISEDEIFINFETKDGGKVRINKKHIISIKEEDNGGNNV